MNNLKIGSFLQALRKAKGLTQAELAEYFEISAKTVSKWECGDSLPELPLLKALAEFYDVSVDEILNGEKGEGRVSIKSKQTNEKYFYSKKIHKLNFVQILSLSILAFGYLMIFILGYPTNRSDVGGWVSVAIDFLSLLSFVFGCFIVGTLEDDINPVWLQSYKRRRLWYCYSYGFSFLFVFVCAILYYVIPANPNLVLDFSSFLWFNLLVLIVILPIAFLFPFILFCLRCFENKKGKVIYTTCYYLITSILIPYAIFAYFNLHELIIIHGFKFEVWIRGGVEDSWMYWIGVVFLLAGLGALLFSIMKRRTYLYCILIQSVGIIFLHIAVYDIISNLATSITSNRMNLFSTYLYFFSYAYVILFFVELSRSIYAFVKKRKIKTA